MEFEFKEWIKEYELTEETESALLEKGFNSYKTLCLLTAEDVRKEFKKLLPAQGLLLQEGIRLLRPVEALVPPSSRHRNQPEPTVEPAETTAEGINPLPEAASKTNLSVQDLLRICGLGENPGEAMTGQQTGNDSLPATDPYCLGSGPFANKYRHIGKHITSLNSKAEEDTTVSIGGVNFQMTGEKKVPLEKVKLPQFMEASMCILRAMIIEEATPTQRVLDYVNYIIQIGRFAQTFSWPSVLSYDAIYRRQQSELGFRWGTSSSTLMQTHLRADIQAAGTKPNQPNVKDPKSGNFICQRWNGRNGCTLTYCTYAHKCRTCFSTEHPQYRHQQAAEQPPKN